jgi:hypothetical protein
MIFTSSIANALFRFAGLICLIWGFGLFSCQPDNPADAPTEETTDCRIYQKHIKKLENYLLEAERNSDRMEEVLYRLTQNYMVIDQKIRLIQKYKGDGSQEKLMKRTASDINRFFSSSQALLDSVEREIQASSLPQSSMLPILETVKEYLYHQEKLFVEVYGSITSIQSQVDYLKKNIARKEAESTLKTSSASSPQTKTETAELERQIENRDRENRKIFYMIGSKKDLERARVIKKTGGFLGIGGTLQLSDKFEELFFQTGDYEIITEISLGNTQKLNLVSTHPGGSYLIIKTPGEWYLKITNPKKFWSISRYLVAEVDE